MRPKLRVLIVDDSQLDSQLLVRELRRAYEVEFEQVDTAEAMGAALDRQTWDLIISDIDLPRYSGVAALQLAVARGLDLPLLIVSGREDEQTALAAMRAGAHDYFVKGELARLLPAIERELREAQQRRARRAAEQALQQASAQTADILETISDAFYAVDGEWRITYVNRQAERMWGRPREALLGRVVWEVFPQAVGSEVYHMQHRAAREQAPLEFEAIMPSFGRWVRVNVSPHGSGQSIFFRDISERKEVERERAYHATLLANLNDAVVAADAQLRVTAWNQAAEAIYGWTAAEALGRPASDVLGDDFGGASRDEVFAALAREGRLSGETVHHHRDGRTIYIEFRTTALRDAAGAIIGFVSVNRPITERKRAEARIAAFAQLGHQLSAATTRREAALIIVNTADRLLGWHACWLDLYDAQADMMYPVLRMDELEGQRAHAPGASTAPPSKFVRNVINEGGRRLLRTPHKPHTGGLMPYGNRRRSASLMFVPIRNGPEVRGVLSIQSYAPNAYTPADLETLQALADHCAGALDRIRAEEQHQATRATLQSFYDSSPLLMGVVELDGDDIVHLYDNAATERFFGAAPAATRNRRSAELGAPAAVEATWAAHYRRSLAARQPVRFEYEHPTPAGPRWLAVTVSLITPGSAGRPRFSYVAEDVTERKRAEGALHAARDAAVRAAGRVARLQAVTSRLSEALVPADVVDVILAQAAPDLGVRGCLVLLLTTNAAGHRELILAGAAGYPDALQTATEQVPFTVPLGVTRAVLRGQPLWLESRDAVARCHPLLWRVHALLQFEAAAVLPMLASGRPVGVLVFSFAEARSFSASDQAYMTTLAHHCAQALERARLYEAERRARLELDQRVSRRTAELQTANDRLETEMAERQRAEAGLERSREEERASMAHTIHDELGSALTGLKMDLKQLERQATSGEPVSLERMRSMASLIDATIAALRRIAMDLRPALLDDLGLLAAIDWRVHEFEAHTGIAAQLITEGAALTLDRDQSNALYRVLQEALTNVARHAEATTVAVRLAVSDSTLRLEIEDDGRGIDVSASGHPYSLGLVGMRERVRLLRGELSIASRPGGGTRVTVTVPLPARNGAA